MGEFILSWNSRERVVATINHKEPDRVPIDVQTGFVFYQALKSYLDIDIRETVRPSYFREVIPHPKIVETMGWDVISVKLEKPAVESTQIEVEGDEMIDGWGVGRKRVYQPGGDFLWEAVVHPLADASLDDLDKYPWPKPEVPGAGEATEAFAKRIYEDTDLAIIGRFGGTIIEAAIDLMGLENWLVAAALDPEFAGVLLDKITDVAITFDQFGLECAGKYLQIFKVSGDDLGMQTGLLYSPKFIRELLLPRLARRWNAAREYIDKFIDPSIPLMFHSDGGIRSVIPDIISAGIGVLNPIQPNCKGMDVWDLKRDFGEQLVFHGGIDIQYVIPFGSETEIRSHVRQQIEALGVGGGYILSPAHIVQADTPLENILFMTQAAHEYGRYPLAV